MASASDLRNLFSAQRRLREHVAELQNNGELVNVHCYAIRNLCNVNEVKIEVEFEKIIDEIRKAKDKLLKEFNDACQEQLGSARKSWISIVNEKQLCLDLSHELQMVMSDDAEVDDNGERIKKLCRQITETCTKRTEFQVQQTSSGYGPSVDEMKRRLFAIASHNLAQATVSLSDMLGEKKAEETVKVKDTVKEYRLKLRNVESFKRSNQANGMDDDEKCPVQTTTGKLKRHYIVRGSNGNGNGSPKSHRSGGSVYSAVGKGSTTASYAGSTTSDASVFTSAASSGSGSGSSDSQTQSVGFQGSARFARPRDVKSSKRRETRPRKGSRDRDRNGKLVGHQVSEKQKVWRRRQIQIGKNSQGYRNLISMHPSYLRDINPSKANRRKCFPALVYPPDVDENIGKKRWSGKYRQWRLFLHGFVKSSNIAIIEQ